MSGKKRTRFRREIIAQSSCAFSLFFVREPGFFSRRRRKRTKARHHWPGRPLRSAVPSRSLITVSSSGPFCYLTLCRRVNSPAKAKTRAEDVAEDDDRGAACDPGRRRATLRPPCAQLNGLQSRKFITFRTPSGSGKSFNKPGILIIKPRKCFIVNNAISGFRQLVIGRKFRRRR